MTKKLRKLAKKIAKKKTLNKSPKPKMPDKETRDRAKDLSVQLLSINKEIGCKSDSMHALRFDIEHLKNKFKKLQKEHGEILERIYAADH